MLYFSLYLLVFVKEKFALRAIVSSFDFTGYLKNFLGFSYKFYKNVSKRFFGKTEIEKLKKEAQIELILEKVKSIMSKNLPTTSLYVHSTRPQISKLF